MDETSTSTLPQPDVLIAEPVATAQPETQFSPKAIWRRMHRVSPFGSNVFLTTLGNFALAGLALVTGPVAARLLGPTGRGELAAIQNLFLLLATLGMLGLPDAALYFTAKAHRSPISVLSSALVAALAFSPIVILVGYFATPLLLAAQDPHIVGFARFYMLGLPLYALTVIPLYVLRGTNDLIRWNALRILPGLGWFLFLLAAMFVKKQSPQLLAIGYLFILGIVCIPILFVVRRTVMGSFKVDPTTWKPLLRYGVPLAGATIPVTLNLRLDQMLMAAWLPATALGFYVVAVSWAAAVAPVLGAIASVLFPRIASIVSRDESVAVLARGVRVAVCVAATIGCFVVLITPTAIPLLFGRAFHPSIKPAVILVWAACMSGLNVVLEQGLQGLGESMTVFWCEIGAACVTCTGLVILLPRWGIMGAAVSSLVSYTTLFIFLVARLSKKTRKPVADFIQPKLGDWSLLRKQMQKLGASS